MKGRLNIYDGWPPRSVSVLNGSDGIRTVAVFTRQRLPFRAVAVLCLDKQPLGTARVFVCGLSHEAACGGYNTLLFPYDGSRFTDTMLLCEEGLAE